MLSFYDSQNSYVILSLAVSCHWELDSLHMWNKIGRNSQKIVAFLEEWVFLVDIAHFYRKYRSHEIVNWIRVWRSSLSVCVILGTMLSFTYSFVNTMTLHRHRRLVLLMLVNWISIVADYIQQNKGCFYCNVVHTYAPAVAVNALLWLVSLVDCGLCVCAECISCWTISSEYLLLVDSWSNTLCLHADDNFTCVFSCTR